MNLISILIALAVETFYKPVSDFRRYDWVSTLVEKIYNKLASYRWRNGPMGVIVIAGLIIFVVWLVQAMLAGVAGLFSFLFGLLVLVYCLGPKDLLDDVHKFIQALEQGDADVIKQCASEVITNDSVSLEDKNSVELAEQVKDAIVVTANVRVFGVIVWFMLLGPVGAALFRLACLLERHPSINNEEFKASTDRLYEIMLWPSARLSVIGFALTGSFVDTIANWRSVSDFWKANSEELLTSSANGAVRYEHSEEHDDEEAQPDVEGINNMLALIKRTLIVWLAVLGLMTLTGWVL
ncbi:MAG: regulatory signaling modulator protein AmpE [Gammaproteobacteria bacterium]|nr:regulatory signaling modulator protein AmpE [Gammaproteobacteria bacterium]